MRTSKRRKLEAGGWKVGSASEFLDLDRVESALVELRLALGQEVRELRVERGLTQIELARRLGSSQSRVAKMEAADRSVSIDLLVRSLLALGLGPAEVMRSTVR